MHCTLLTRSMALAVDVMYEFGPNNKIHPQKKTKKTKVRLLTIDIVAKALYLLFIVVMRYQLQLCTTVIAAVQKCKARLKN